MTNKELPQGTQVYQSAKGLENGAQHFIMGDGKNIEETKKIMAASKFNDQAQEYINKLDDYSKEVEEQAKHITENMNDLELVPYGMRLLIKPYSQNPYQKIKVSDSGIVVDLGGMAPVVRSNETGEFVEEEAGIIVGKIIEVGPDVKYAREGDDVFYLKASAAPVPFFKQGFVTINENQALTFVNVGLKERFKEVKCNCLNGCSCK